MINLRALIPCLALVCSIVCATAAASQPQNGEFGDSRDVVTVTVTNGLTQAAPGEWVPIAVIFDVKRKWHIHTNDPRIPPEMGSPSDVIRTEIVTRGSQDGRLVAERSAIQWPAAHTVDVKFLGPKMTYDVFEDRAIAYLPVRVAPDAEPGVASMNVAVTFQACDDMVCLAPADQSFRIEIGVVESNLPSTSGYTYPEIFAGFSPARLPATESGGGDSDGAGAAGGSTAMPGVIGAGILAVVAAAGLIVAGMLGDPLRLVIRVVAAIVLLGSLGTIVLLLI